MVIGRSYYAMYHAARSVVFLNHGGDDFQEHDRLPGHLPPDFVERDNWENRLKNARYERNKADYEPYPKRERSLHSVAADILEDAENLTAECRLYLRVKGCKL
jgi:uncharacterized protein (UPF0332 family)